MGFDEAYQSCCRTGLTQEEAGWLRRGAGPQRGKNDSSNAKPSKNSHSSFMLASVGFPAAQHAR